CVTDARGSGLDHW
nr:immunoglobulin heavy chain junction region [Macaca mulatta]MOV58450.1 immunoglobulin heavy chain junction region [Macaca mulatta]